MLFRVLSGFDSCPVVHLLRDAEFFKFYPYSFLLFFEDSSYSTLLCVFDLLFSNHISFSIGILFIFPKFFIIFIFFLAKDIFLALDLIFLMQYLYYILLKYLFLMYLLLLGHILRYQNILYILLHSFFLLCYFKRNNDWFDFIFLLARHCLSCSFEKTCFSRA